MIGNLQLVFANQRSNMSCGSYFHKFKLDTRKGEYSLLSIISYLSRLSGAFGGSEGNRSRLRARSGSALTATGSHSPPTRSIPSIYISKSKAPRRVLLILVDPRGIEPLSEGRSAKLSTSVFGLIFSLPVAIPTKIGGGSSFIRDGYKSNSPFTFTA